MRALLLAAVAFVLLLAQPTGGAHAPTECHPERVFPSFAGWIMPPGRILSYALPANQFATVTSLAPVDVTLSRSLTCEPDVNCHHHGATGLVACGTYQHAVVEIVNHGPDAAPVFLAIGQCGHGMVC